MSLLLLASFGVASYGGTDKIAVLVGAAVLVATALLTLQSRTLTDRLLSLLRRLPLGAGLEPKLREALESSQALLGLSPLVAGLGLGSVAWLCECLGYWFAFDAFPEPVDMDLSVGIFAYSFSTVAGVVSPGGIGPTDVGLIELARKFTPALESRADLATAAAFIVRVCTLWFAVGLGAIALLRFRGFVDTAGSASGPSPGRERGKGGPEGT